MGRGGGVEVGGVGLFFGTADEEDEDAGDVLEVVRRWLGCESTDRRRRHDRVIIINDEEGAIV